MQSIRIVEIPLMKAAYSGPLTSEAAFTSFNAWFTAYHARLKCELFPRDFMRYNERLGVREWFYALPEGERDAGDFEIVDLPAGLFAVASCLDADLDQAADWLDTYRALQAWAQKSDRFMPYRNAPDRPERYAMFHIVSPGRLQADGISIEDLYLPIEERR